MMICAPWINTSVSCLVDGKDHRPCCKQRGLPDLCLPLCEGKIERIDFRFFRCLTFMSSYTNCLMQGYGVLASAPTKPFLRAMGPSWAVFEWSPPVNLSYTVTSYNFHSKSITDDQRVYHTITKAKTPFIFNHIRPDSSYEVYVTAINKYGASEPSPRLEFQTPKVDDETNATSIEEETTSDGYNFTECCLKSRMNVTCTPLCTYKAKMTDLHTLGPICMPEFHKLLKCAVGGRDHVPCCMRRMVSLDCTSLCSGMVPHFSSAMAAICIPYIPDIIMCMEEGVSTLPGPIRELHAFAKNKTMIGIEWLPPLESNVTHYEVRYQGEYMDISRDKITPPLENEVLNVTETSLTITTLRENVLYSLYVVSVNEFGLSIPSAVLTFNTTTTRENLNGVVSPPHSLTVTRRNTTSLVLTWLPPDFSHPTDALTYNVYYKAHNDTDFLNTTTTTLVMLLSRLLPNTEYFVYVTAETDKGESWPSEKIRVWTDPVFPAFVEMPRVHPSTQIEEGGTMTILCVASGTPVPLVGVYISGRRIFEEFTRHLIARVSNISRDMNVVTCTADNGVGIGSQATQRIKISYSPLIVGKRPQIRRIGENTLLECIVDGFPKPLLTWWKDQDKKTPVVPDARISTGLSIDDDGNDVFQLLINDAVASDEGPYYCNADNPYGSSMDKVSLQLEPSLDTNSNVSSCCIEEKVHPDCMDACTFDIDIEAVMNKENCVSELSKLISCAADGSDHRRCCQTWGIPKRCIGLCQGKQLLSFNVPLCILSWSKQIVACFQEGKQILPGVPENLRAKALTANSVLVQWDPPTKNPHMVQFYRVIAKPLNQKKAVKVRNDTHGLSLVMTGLIHGLNYEFVIKAGNHYGSSVTSQPFKVNLLDAKLLEVIEKDSDYTVAIIVGIVLTVLLCVVVVIVIVYFKKRLHPPPPDTVSFENPSYMREITSDSAQTNGTSSDHGTRPNESNWKTETLHTPDFDNLYEVPSDDRAGLKKAASRPGYISVICVKILITIMVLIAMYAEIIVYYIDSYKWKTLPPNNKDKSIRLLLVADPQIQGYDYEPFFPFGVITRWDSDRYLSKTFTLATKHTQPEMIIFLGDLMDEGSVTTDQVFSIYAKRFFNLFATKGVVKLYIPGDNDIGGEGSDKVTDQKVIRFRELFHDDEHVIYKFVEFARVNYFTREVEKTDVFSNKKRILVTHFPLLPVSKIFGREVY
uniref:Uncharacterized protein n=1 Tax=Strigamia maritima TaxID=126957 RepID=T1JD05_STRMM